MIHHRVLAIALTAVLSLVARADDGVLHPAEVGASEGMAPVAVPEGDGAPVITDGLYTAGEWDDARAIDVAAGVTLLVKESRGVVFIGIRGRDAQSIGPSELSLATPDGSMVKLHVSAQLYEVALPPEGPEPSPRFGLTTDWYANELRRDMAMGEQLRKEGKSPIEIIMATSYPSDGIEFAIRRAKLAGNRWLVRLAVSGVFDSAQQKVIFPPNAAERATEGWLELQLD